MNYRRGFFVIDGCVGAGKSSVLAKLKLHLPNFHFTREPGATELGSICRALILESQPELNLFSSLFLVLADRAQHLVKLRTLDGPIISDRYYPSTVAYWGAAHGLGEELVENICLEVCGDFLPELTFILDVDPEIGRQRKLNQGSLDNLDGRSLEFHAKARKSFQRQAHSDPGRFILIDTSNIDLDSVVRMVLHEILHRYEFRSE